MKKSCSRCGQIKNISLFVPFKRSMDGYFEWCKTCKSEYDSQRYRNNREEMLKNQKDYYKTDRGKEALRENSKRMYKKYPKKWIARSKLNYALKNGNIVKGACERCGSDSVQAHHPNYNKPLEVLWLCPSHHREIHNISL